MNSTTARFIPSIIAGIALIACFLPFSFNPNAVNLFAMPGVFAKALGATALMTNPSKPPIDASLISTVIQLMYLAPLLAVAAIGLNIAGKQGPMIRLMQIGTGIVWILIATVIPVAAGLALIELNPVLREMAKASGNSASWITLNFGFGGWLLAASGAALIFMPRGYAKAPVVSPAE